MGEGVKSGRAYRGESAAQRDLRRRRQIIEAGLEIFGSEGFRAATVRGLCAQARVADRNFYANFDSLEDLLIAVHGECIERLFAAVLTQVGEVSAGDPLGPILERSLDAFYATIEDPLLARVVWREVFGVSDRVTRAYIRRMDEFADYIVGVLLAVDPALELTPERKLLAVSAVGGLSHLAMTWSLNDYEPPREVIVGVAKGFLDGVAQHVIASS